MSLRSASPPSGALRIAPCRRGADPSAAEGGRNPGFARWALHHEVGSAIEFVVERNASPNERLRDGDLLARPVKIIDGARTPPTFQTGENVGSRLLNLAQLPGKQGQPRDLKVALEVAPGIVQRKHSGERLTNGTLLRLRTWHEPCPQQLAEL
jgi:hypothetical protein